MSQRVCPKCGLPYSYLEKREVNGRVYYYAVHYYREGGKRRKRRCYLGPKVYGYVSPIQGFPLRGMNELGRYLEYLEHLVVELSEAELSEAEAEKVIELGRKLIEVAERAKNRASSSTHPL